MPAPVKLPLPLALDLERVIERFPTSTLDRGSDYHEEQRVSNIRCDDVGPATVYSARVKGTRQYTTSWMLRAGVWHSACSCPVAVGCKHALALALHLIETADTEVPPVKPAPGLPPKPSGGGAVVTKQQPEPQRAPPADPVQQELQKLFGSTLEAMPREIQTRIRCFADVLKGIRVGRWPGRVELEGIGLLAERQSWIGAEPAEVQRLLRRTDPTPATLAAALVVHAQRMQLRYPEFLELLATPELAATRDRDLRERLERSTERLIESLQTAIEPAPSRTREPWPEIRIRIAGPQSGEWQAFDPKVGIWKPYKGINSLMLRVQRDPEGVAPALARLLHTLPESLRLAAQRRTNSAKFEIYAADSTNFLVGTLLDETTRGCVVGLDGLAATHAPQRVTLEFAERKESPGIAGASLVFEDGAPCASPYFSLRVEGRGRLVLTGGRLGWLTAGIESVVESQGVLMELLRTPRFAGIAKRLGVRTRGFELPAPEEQPELQTLFEARIEWLDLTQKPALLLRLSCVERPGGPAVLQCDAGQWRPVVAGGRDLGAFTIPTLHAATAALEEWSGKSGMWTPAGFYRVPCKADFPEAFQEWAERIRSAGVHLEVSADLAPLFKAAEKVSVRLTTRADPSGVDWFDAEVAFDAGDLSLSAAEVALLLKNNGRPMLLPGKGFRKAAIEGGEETVEALATAGFSLEDALSGRGKQRLHAFQLTEGALSPLLDGDTRQTVRERLEHLRSLPAPPIPSGLHAELRPYQKEGFHFLAHLSSNRLGGVLADDMGLGKTVQTLAWLLWVRGQLPEERRVLGPKVLVVAPKSVVPNWVNEVRRFAPELTVETGGRSAAMLTVINYAQLRLRAEQLVAIDWDCVILDEGQNIKNPHSQVGKVARMLRAERRLVLTGTPIENRPLDLWSLFAFAQPGLLGTQASFTRAYPAGSPTERLSALASRVRPFMLRRSKKQVATDLPERIEEDLVVELEPEQRELYDAELKRARLMLLKADSAGLAGERFNILQSLLRLRQICCDPALIGSGSEAVPAKVNALAELIEPLVEEGHKVLIFSQFVSMLLRIGKMLEQQGIAYQTITGATENRQQLVDRFQAGEGGSVFLLSLKAAGAGLNLTAASYVVLFDPWWNPAVEAQAIDRTHRIGQKSTVIAYRFIAKDTVEEKIRALQKAKAEVANAVVVEESLASVLNLEDLRFVLG